MVEYKYRFPEHSDNIDNRDIFGEQNKYNFFIGARGLTFLGTYDEFVKGFPMENEITSKIPMGYKGLCLYERLSIIEKGKIIWSNSDVNAINVEKLKYGDFYYTKEKNTLKICILFLTVMESYMGQIMSLILMIKQLNILLNFLKKEITSF